MTEADKAALELAERTECAHAIKLQQDSWSAVTNLSEADRDLIICRLTSPASVPEGHVAQAADEIDRLRYYLRQNVAGAEQIISDPSRFPAPSPLKREQQHTGSEMQAKPEETRNFTTLNTGSGMPLKREQGD